MANQYLWALKVKAFLRCPPDSALIPKDRERERAEEVILKVLDDRNIPEEVDIAHENAYALDSPPFVRSREVDFLKEPVLTHSLSGSKWKLKESPLSEGWDGNEDAIRCQAKRAVEDALEELKSQYGNDHQRLFLTLWRLLPEKIKGKEKSSPKLGPLWDVIPADPCIPDHSVWDHASVASALAPTVSDGKPKAAFLIFTIASVQGFLADARRTQDLWMGSFLLSFLIWEAIKVIAERSGPDCLIYPDLRGQPFVDLWLNKEKGIADVKVPPIGAMGVANLPNIFTALLPYKKAKEIAEEAEEKMKERWKEIAYKVKGKIEEAIVDLVNDEAWNGMWKGQVDDFLDSLGVFWVVCPWGEDPKEALREYKAVMKSTEEATEAQDKRPLERLMEAVERTGGSLAPGMAYQAFSALAGMGLTARKNLRDFPQKEEPGHKCSLCGVRQVLCPEGENLKDFWERLMRMDELIKLRGRIRRGDRLCAVCLTKRLAWEHYFIPYFRDKGVPGIDPMAHVLFPSTATIATAKFREEIINQFNELSGELCAYVERVKGFLEKYRIFLPSAPIPKLEKLKDGDHREVINDFLRLDGEWLFVESFNKEAIEREYGLKVNEGDLKEAKEALEKLLRKVGELKIRRPRKYYALISMDGDKMGDWVAGKMGPEFGKLLHPSVQNIDPGVLSCKPRPLGPSLHKGLSGALKNFALYAVRCVVEEEHCGKLIYAGGDDVLAFVPLDEFFDVMRKLRLFFAGEGSFGKIAKMGPGFVKVEEDGKRRLCMMAGEGGPTISAGVIIAHYTHPFSHAVEEAHGQALIEDAKEAQGRDAFAIHLLKRSGEPVKVGAKWSYKELDVLEVLGKVSSWIRDEKLSSRLMYKMKEEAPGLSAEVKEVWSLEDLKEARLSELKRLIGRHIKEEDETKRKAIQEEVEKELEELLRSMEMDEAKERQWKLWDEVTNLLLVARFVAEEM